MGGNLCSVPFITLTVPDVGPGSADLTIFQDGGCPGVLLSTLSCCETLSVDHCLSLVVHLYDENR